MSRFRTLLAAAAVVVGAGVAPLLTSAPAGTAPCTANEQYDGRTGICWSRQDLGNRGSAQGPGGTAMCSPGRLGQCLGAAQNGQQPGANLRTQPPAGPAPRTTWPNR